MGQSGRERARLIASFEYWLLVLLLVYTGSTFAQNDPLVERREADFWLSRIQKAAQRQNYTGIFTYQRGNTLQSSRITHYSEGGDDEYERVELLDGGKQREILRHNDEVQNLYPDQRLVVVEHRERPDAFPALLVTSKIDILDYYAFRKLGIERVAGLDCQLISLEPRDRFRYGYRIWVEQKSGLLLRAQTIADGRVLEQVAFSQIQLGIPVDRQRITRLMRSGNNTGWTTQEATSLPVNLSDQGWLIVPPVKGFVRIREVRRLLGNNGKDGHEVMQAVFSDGLASLSVFIEPVSVQRQRQSGMATRGTTNILVRRMEDYWITLIGEVPALTIQQFAASVEHKKVK